MSEARSLTFEELRSAVAGSACAFRCRCELQPAAGEGGKVFPPTYAGAVYAKEQRRVPGRDEPVECVLLDSVQSQANRMEEALQAAVDTGRLKIPVIEVDFATTELLRAIGKVTSLQAPHRIADAILRDSLLNGKPFRETAEGMSLSKASPVNATTLYRLCPTALIFGLWDSTGPMGGLGAKFQRTIVSEIVGIDAVYGVKTSSRIDPLQVRAAVKVIKREGGWVIADDPKAKGTVSPAEVNHGNITPDITPGGVTITAAEQTITLSLPALRRLRFPLNGEVDCKVDCKVDQAGQTVLAALALCAVALTAEKGFDLRSRCLLWPAGPMEWELLDRPGQSPSRYAFAAGDALSALEQAVIAAEKVGLRWSTTSLKLTPAPQLVELVRRSQERDMVRDSEEGDG
ncbi:MAG: type I-U CRISPR-associated RAMP protein Csb1/Cas7u [Candidatus Latescibacterota bacterium]